MRDNIKTVQVIASALAGAALVGIVLGRRRRRRQDTRQALGGAGGTRLRETVTINRPAPELFRFWRSLSNLPSFVRHLERVDEYDHGRSHWVMRGPAGMSVEWDAELINEIEPDLLAWRSLPGSDLVSAGSVRFRPRSRGRTDVTVTMQYEPAGGTLGSALAWMSGYSPVSELREDLKRLKKMMERQEAPTDDVERVRSRLAALTESS